MGTRVQSKSYIPGYNLMRNLDEGSSSSWSLYYENKALNGNLYNDFILRPVNGYSGYDKEMLKRMMLEHEAIFRKQVCELHRLYRRQKDLMNELKKKDLHKLPVQMETSQSNIFSSQMPFETTEKIWQMPFPTAVNNSYNCAVVAGTDDRTPPLTFLKENCVQSSQIPSKNGVSVKDGELFDSKLTRFPRQMLDLQLPADVYIDCEYAERTEEKNVSKSFFRAMDPLSIICDVEHENDVKLTLGTNEGPNCSKGSWKLDSHQQNGRSIHSFADLNEPLKGLSCGGEAGSVTTNFLGARTHCEEIQGHPLQMRSNRSFLPMNFFTDKHRDEGACSNFVNADKEEVGREWPTFDNEAGKSRNCVNSLSPSLYGEKFPMLSEPTHPKLKRANEISPSDHTKTQTWLGEKPSHDIETSRRSSQLADSNCSVQTSPQVPASFSVVPCSDYSSSASPLVSSRRKKANVISHIPIAVQALPCFNGSEMLYSRSRRSNGSIRSPRIARDKLQSNGDLQSRSRFGAESSSYPNGFHHDLLSDSSSSSTQLKNSSDSSAYEMSEGGSQKLSKSPKDLIFNLSLPNGIPECLTSQRDVEGKHEKLSEEVSWLRTKQARNGSQMDLGFSQGYSQLKSSSNTMAPETGKTLQDSPSSLQVKENRKQRNEASHSPRGFLIIDKLQLADDIKSSGKNELRDVGMVSGKGVGDHCLGFRNHINLNSLEISPEDVAEVPSPLFLPIITGKIAPDIDLEVPIPSHGEIIGINPFAMPNQIPSGKTDGRQETECSHETVDRLAAENLVAMSLDIFCSSAPASCDSLHWFADVVSSKAASTKASDNDNDGMDLFESMTLKLEEVKLDEYCSQPQELENQKDNDDPVTASLLLTKPRRRQARKRRQLRDFQKDILPGLASLSRHEVTEDLLAFGGLMTATGRAWQAGLARRSVGRKGSNCQGRGRRRPRSLALAVAETHSSPPPTQPAARSKVEINDKVIMGWGRTTRRGRRPRVKSGNTSFLLLT